MAIGLLGRPVALLMLVLTLRPQFSGAAQEGALVLGSIVWLVRRARFRFAVVRPPAQQRYEA